jgi:DNA-binding MarR family transcriptional regulator
MEDLHRLFHDIYVFLEGGDGFVLDSYNLTTTQYRALTLLDPTNGKSLTTLADQLLRNRSTATRLIDQLEVRGLVKRIDHPHDRRAHEVSLTQAGVELVEEVRHAHQQSLEQRFGVFSPDECETLAALLIKLRESFLDYIGQQEATKGVVSSKSK